MCYHVLPLYVATLANSNDGYLRVEVHIGGDEMRVSLTWSHLRERCAKYFFTQIQMICTIQVECLMEIFLNTFDINSLFSSIMSWIVHVSVPYTVYVRLCVCTYHVLYMHVVNT